MARTPVVAAEVGTALRGVFPEIGERPLSSLVRSVSVVTASRRERILGEEAPARLVLVLDGYVGTWRTDADGRASLLAVSGPGELAALRALSPARVPVELVAITAARVATWDPDGVIATARADGQFAVDLLELALLAADRLVELRTDANGDGSADRLVELLWTRRELAFDAGRPLLTRGQLADLAGASRDATDRLIRELEIDGIVERVGRTGLVLHDEEALRRRAGEPPGF